MAVRRVRVDWASINRYQLGTVLVETRLLRQAIEIYKNSNNSKNSMVY